MHVILVHGAGGSDRSWSLVTPLLAQRGISVSVADNPSQSLEEDVERVTALIDAAEGPVLLVGHSYGGVVISNAGAHEKVKGLVYVAAFAPGAGESVDVIVEGYPDAEIARFSSRGPNGEWTTQNTPEARAALAWDVPDVIWQARDQDIRTSADAIFTTPTPDPAWARVPAWYLVATSDRHIRVEAQRDMAARAGATVREVDTSHAVPHAAPESVVEIIALARDALV